MLAAIAIACWVAALRAVRARQRPPRRPARARHVVALGVPAQAVIGGITVLTDLNPWIVSLHLLVSMAMIGVCVVLLDVLRGPAREATAPPRRLAWLVVRRRLGRCSTSAPSSPAAAPTPATSTPRATGLDPPGQSPTSHAVRSSATSLLSPLTLGGWCCAAGLSRQRRRLVSSSPPLASCCSASSSRRGLLGCMQYFLDLPEALVGAAPARRAAR